MEIIEKMNPLDKKFQNLVFHHQLGVIFLLTILAGLLRFYKLSEWSFWIDEILHLNRTQIHYGSLDQLLQNIIPNYRWFPTSIIMTSAALKLGVGEWTARFASAAIGVFSVPILYFPVKKMFGTGIGVLFAILLAISPWHVFWSQNARFYTSLMLLYSLALFSFYFGIEQDRPRYFILFYIFFYLALSERLIAVLLLPVIMVYLLLLWVLPFPKPPGLRWKNIIILFSPIVFFLVYEVITFVLTGSNMFTSTMDGLGRPVDSPVRLLVIIVFRIGIPIVCLAFFCGIFLLLMKKRDGLILFVSATVPVGILAVLNLFVFTVDRYVFITLVSWMILAAIAIKTISQKVKDLEFILVLGIISVILFDAGGSHLMYYQINHGNRLNWREAVTIVKERKQADDVVISSRWQLAKYYLQEDVMDWRDISPDEFESFDSTVWLIMDYPGIWHGKKDSIEWLENNGQLVYYSYLRVEEGENLRIYKYQP